MDNQYYGTDLESVVNMGGIPSGAYYQHIRIDPAGEVGGCMHAGTAQFRTGRPTGYGSPWRPLTVLKASNLLFEQECHHE